MESKEKESAESSRISQTESTQREVSTPGEAEQSTCSVPHYASVAASEHHVSARG